MRLQQTPSHLKGKTLKQARTSFETQIKREAGFHSPKFYIRWPVGTGLNLKKIDPSPFCLANQLILDQAPATYNYLT